MRPQPAGAAPRGSQGRAEQEGGNNGQRLQRGCWFPEQGWGGLGPGGHKDCGNEVPAQETNEIND